MNRGSHCRGFFVGLVELVELVGHVGPVGQD